MKKFLFVVPPFTGHINPTLSIGRELLSHGHDVAWFGVGEYIQRVLPDGAILFPSPENRVVSTPIQEAIGRVQNSKGAESFQNLYEQVLIPLSHAMQPLLQSVIYDYSPDIIIHDHEAFIGAICAVQAGIPYVTSVTAPAVLNDMSLFPKVAAWKDGQILELQRSCGLQNTELVTFSNELVLIYSSTEFIGHTNFPEHFKFVGPALKNREVSDDFDWHDILETPKPRILVSLGTFIQGMDTKFFTNLVQGLRNEPVTIIAVTREGYHERWPDNFIVKQHIPQLEMLRHVDMVICHGGHNTVCESLYNGLPLIVIPYATDQFSVASQVEQSGCGIRLNHSRLKPDSFTKAVQEILRQPSYRTSASSIQHTFINAGGTEKAVEYLEHLLKPNLGNGVASTLNQHKA